MSAVANHEDALAALDAVGAWAGQAYRAHHATRLDQLGAALGTARMVVEHLADEEAREVDLAHRIVARETVHGQHEVTDPHGRSYAETLRIAGKG